MPTLREWITRLLGTLRPGRADRDLEQELRLHLELAAEDARRQGGLAEPAMRAARIRAGGVAQTMEALRDQRRLPSLGDLMRDLRYGWRALARTPSLFAAGVFALGLGIGGPSIMYGILGPMLGPLSVERPFDVVNVNLMDPVRGSRQPITNAVFRNWAASTTSFETLGVYAADEVSVNGAGASPERYQAAYVSSGIFQILNARIVAGRGFSPEDFQDAATPTAIIREDLWEERFHRSPDAFGAEIRIDGVMHTIIGVCPSDFGFPRAHRLWMAMPSSATFAPYARVLGRLKPGVREEVAAAELRSALSDNPGGLTVVVREFVSAMSGDEPALLARYLYLLVTFLVFMAALNVAGLLLARGSARSADVALRLAIGGSRLRVMRHVLIEAFLLAVGGTLVGLLLAGVALDWVTATLEARGSLAYWGRPEVDRSLVVFATVLMAVATLVAGLVPALRTSRVNLSQAIKPGALTGGEGGLSRTLPVLVGVEVALSCTLLVLSALIVKGAIARTAATDPFPQRDVLTARLVLERYDYPDVSSRGRFRNDLMQRMSSDPEVRDFAFTTSLPGDGASVMAFRAPAPGATAEDDRNMPQVQYRRVSPSFFSMFAMRVIDGRLLTDSDAAEGRPVVIVNEAFRRRWFPEDAAVGKRLRVGAGDLQSDVEVIGVVSDPGVTVDDDGRVPGMFLPMDEPTQGFLVAMRAQKASGAALPILARNVGAVDPALPLGNVSTLAAVIRREHDGERVFGTLFAAVGAASLMLAVVGLHGLVAFTVSRREREIGIMRALGARSVGVLRTTLARSMTPVAIGLALGIGVAFVATPLIGEGLFGANPHDPVVFVFVPLALVLAAAAAALGPARRAIRLDPMRALRAE